ncbi:MAG: GAF domain-containing protein [Nitrospirae bacterium]|nr:GAF domain-containing protein [Nitrospirota bacterium]
MDDKDKLIEQLNNELQQSKRQITELEASCAIARGQEYALHRARRALTAVRECQTVLFESTDEMTLLKETCRVIVEKAGYRLAWIGYSVQEEDKLVKPEAHFGYEDGYLKSLRISWANDVYGYGPTGTAIRTGKPAICRDMLRDPQYTPWRDEALKRGFASSMALPLIKDGVVYGALNIYAAEPDAFDDDEKNLLINMNELLSFGINECRIRLERDKYCKTLIENEMRHRLAAQQLAAAVKINEQNMRNSRLLDSIFKYTLDSIVLLDKDFNFIRVSDTYARVCQRDVTEFIGRNHFELYPSDFKEEAEEVKRRKHIYSKSERSFVFPDHPEWGTTYWDLGLVPILDKDNEVEYFLFTLKDVTLKKRYKDELRELNVNLQKRIDEEVEKSRRRDQLMYEQARHIAMGELLVNIAHQWRQPLCAIGVMVQDILDAYIFNELDEQYIEKSAKCIMKELLYLSDTIDDFKIFYERDKVKNHLNILHVVNRTLLLMADYFKSRGVTVDINIDGMINVYGYTNELSQVILNLLTNIRDIFEERRVNNGIVKIASYRETNTGRVVLTISDNGGGISNDIMGKIFDPYFTTKDKTRGTGLGLYIAKVIIEKNMQGAISVSNTVDGCQFRIEL